MNRLRVFFFTLFIVYAAFNGRVTAAETQVEQNIHYFISHAGEVFFVWGINGWKPVPEELRPPGTWVKNNMLHTPMVRGKDGKSFTASIQVPADATIDYGFLITKTPRESQITPVWDGGYSALAQTGAVIAVRASSVLVREIPGSGVIGFPEIGLLIFACVVIGWALTLLWSVSSPSVEATFFTQVNVSQKRLLTFAAIILIGNLFFLGGTAYFTYLFRQLPADGWQTAPLFLTSFLVQCNLADENVLAAWYSSMLLLFVAVFSLLCFAADIQRARSSFERFLSWGWVIFALLFWGLSLDEVGSLHEGIGLIPGLRSLGSGSLGWTSVLILPICGVGLFMLIFGWVQLKRYPRALLFLTLGVILFLSVPLQEKIEMRVLASLADIAPGQRPIWHILVEEGSEIFGSLSFFCAMAIYLSIAVKENPRRDQVGNLELPLVLKRRPLLAGAALFVGVSAISMFMLQWASPILSTGEEGVDGIPQNWFPSMLAALIALFCLQLSKTEFALRRALSLLTAGLAIVLSAYWGSNWAGYTFQAPLSSAQFLIFQGGPLSVAGFVVVFLLFAIKKPWCRFGVHSWIVLLTIAMSAGMIYMAPLAFMAESCLLLALLGHVYASLE